MNPRVMDAVGLIGQFVTDHFEHALNQNELKDALINHGFSEDEISNAFKWIEEHTLGELAVKNADQAMGQPVIRPPARPLTAYEKSKISTKAYGVLMRYFDRGLLVVSQVEEILERAMRIPGEEISARQMKRLTALVLFNQMQADWRDQLHANSTLVN